MNIAKHVVTLFSCVVVGLLLSKAGYYVTTWQFWVVTVLFVFVFTVLLELHDREISEYRIKGGKYGDE